jgi:hypothetical protein
MKTGRDIQSLAAEIARQAGTKKDFIAQTDKVEVGVADEKVFVGIGDKGQFPIGDIAHGQIAEHTKIPKSYYDRMKTEAPGLLANNIREWFGKYPAPRMFRTLDSGNRAFLSDRFNTLDNVDFGEAALPMLLERNLDVMSCEITERRLYIKAVDKRLFRDVPVGYRMGDGSHRIFETFAPAIVLANSEVGFGRLVVETGVYTSACTNLALFAKGGMKRTHVGARHKLTEGLDADDLDAIMSDKTEAQNPGGTLAPSARRRRVGLRRQGDYDARRADRSRCRPCHRQASGRRNRGDAGEVRPQRNRGRLHPEAPDGGRSIHSVWPLRRHHSRVARRRGL